MEKAKDKAYILWPGLHELVSHAEIEINPIEITFEDIDRIQWSHTHEVVDGKSKVYPVGLKKHHWRTHLCDPYIYDECARHMINELTTAYPFMVTPNKDGGVVHVGFLETHQAFDMDAKNGSIFPRCHDIRKGQIDEGKWNLFTIWPYMPGWGVKRKGVEPPPYSIDGEACIPPIPAWLHSINFMFTLHEIGHRMKGHCRFDIENMTNEQLAKAVKESSQKFRSEGEAWLWAFEFLKKNDMPQHIDTPASRLIYERCATSYQRCADINGWSMEWDESWIEFMEATGLLYRPETNRWEADNDYTEIGSPRVSRFIPE